MFSVKCMLQLDIWCKYFLSSTEYEEYIFSVNFQNDTSRTLNSPVLLLWLDNNYGKVSMPLIVVCFIVKSYLYAV